MNKSIVGYGSIVLSAYGLGNKISGLFGIPTSGIGSALATFTGQNLGANNIKRVKENDFDYLSESRMKYLSPGGVIIDQTSGEVIGVTQNMNQNNKEKKENSSYFLNFFVQTQNRIITEMKEEEELELQKTGEKIMTKKTKRTAKKTQKKSISEKSLSRR